MEPADFLSLSATALGVFAALGGNRLAAGEPSAGMLTWEVRCHLTDADNRGIPEVDLRIALGDGPELRRQACGVAFRTDRNGRKDITVVATLRPGAIKRPTNFMDSLFSRKEPTDELQLAAELSFLGRRVLYVFPLHRFRSDGSVLLEGGSVWEQEADGNFNHAVPRDADGGWRFSALDGLALTDPGLALASCSFRPDPRDPGGRRWILECQFKRAPEPVRR